jgi:Carboxypeptidase regulatory-like domain
MKRWFPAALIAALALAVSAPAYAQGGGASSTGTIQGRVTDAQGAVLPGVTVTATSPALLGQQTTVTSDTGNYRFPAVPPGAYTVTYELAGFNAVKREGIQIALGFTANVNVELQLATLQETVTVTGQSPVIDTSATRIQQNFKMEQLQGLPNARDMWALLAVTPSVQMARIDVGGNRAGTQTGYTAYGFNGQVRVLIEGINTTEGTGGAGFYFDYASLEEAFLGTSGQSAEMPNPGVQSQFIARSGGNQFQGEYHLDWYNNSLQGENLPDEYLAPNAFNGTNGSNAIRPHSNEIQRYYDWDINAGGPIKTDKVWYFGTYRRQFNAVAQPNFQFDKTFNTTLWNAVAKGTYQANQNNKIIGYYQWGQKQQPNRLPFNTYTYASPEQTYFQDSGSWVYKGEWNGTLTDKLYVEARYGDFGYYFPLVTNSPDNFFWHDTGKTISEGAHQRQQLDRDRKQWTAAATYFLDTGAGSHTFKLGGELLKEQSWEGYQQRRGGNIEAVYNNDVSTQVIFGLPTASCEVGTLSAHSCLTSRAALDQIGLFLNDTWTFGRTTLNAGVRYDRYHGWLPEQEQIGATVGRASVQAKTQGEMSLFTWNVFAPRLGVIFDLSGDGRTVIKGNYGFYWHNPGVSVPSNGNPNIANKFTTWNWNDANRDKRWQPGEETSLVSETLEGSITVDPDIEAPYSHEASVWLERQLTDTMGARAGFVYKTEDDLIDTYQPGRPPEAFNVPYPFLDLGVNGVRDTPAGATPAIAGNAAGDDRWVTFYGMNNALAGQFLNNQVVMNVPRYGRYKTFEVSSNKRMGNRWSAQVGGSYTWMTNFPTDLFPNNPNMPGVQDRTTWQFKVAATYDGPWGLRFAPLLRHQSGLNFARTVTVSVPAGAAPPGVTLVATSGTGDRALAYFEPADSNREDNIWVVDLRTEKLINFTDRIRTRLYLDLFNIGNSHASETISRATGTSYLKPSAILAPFTARVGFRFIF